VRVPNEKRDRRTYLGGHDVARIVGEERGIADTYARIVHGRDLDQTPAMLRGLIVELGLVRHAAAVRGARIQRDVHVIDDKIRFFGGSLDAIEIPDEDVIYEVTSTTTWNRHLWGVPFTEDCSRTKWIQSQWYMGLEPRVREVHVWCLVVDGDETPLRYTVPRHDAAIAELRERAERFWWDHIVARRPPIPGDVNQRDLDALNACYPRATGSVIDADAELVALAAEYADARAIEKHALARKNVAGARIKAMLREHEGARWAGGSVSWKEVDLKPKPAWEEIAHVIAMRTGMTGETFNGLVAEHTFPGKSQRSLRVNVKGSKQPPKEDSDGREE
jgi:hypothetical protein